MSKIPMALFALLIVIGTAFAVKTDPGHSASEIGGTAIADRTFQSSNYSFPGSLGIGTEPAMERAVRVHANFVEYVPLTLLLLLLAELAAAPAGLLHACGATLVVCRVLHAYGLSQTSGRSFGRFWGTAGTWAVILALSVTLLLRLI